MGSLKDDWKETGKDLGGAFKQLGKSIVKSGAVVVNKANDWAERDDAKEAARKEAEVEKAKEEKAANTVICPNCGAEITDPEAVFCLKCGAKLAK
ncbi:MAG: zinc ribbon domain-containing protein [Clostridiales bacterium]|jgi:ribosomal protein L40E|nr:zinc ribbon domain-containing protein [Clostridiales bacterium]